MISVIFLLSFIILCIWICSFFFLFEPRFSNSVSFQPTNSVPLILSHHCDQEKQTRKIPDIIPIFLNLLGLVWALSHDLSWRLFLVCSRRMHILPLLAECFVNVCEAHLIYIVIQVCCFFIAFLSGWSIHCCKRGIEVPYYYCVLRCDPLMPIMTVNAYNLRDQVLWLLLLSPPLDGTHKWIYTQ